MSEFTDLFNDTFIFRGIPGAPIVGRYLNIGDLAEIADRFDLEADDVLDLADPEKFPIGTRLQFIREVINRSLSGMNPEVLPDEKIMSLYNARTLNTHSRINEIWQIALGVLDADAPPSTDAPEGAVAAKKNGEPSAPS